MDATHAVDIGLAHNDENTPYDVREGKRECKTTMAAFEFELITFAETKEPCRCHPTTPRQKKSSFDKYKSREHIFVCYVLTIHHLKKKRLDCARVLFALHPINATILLRYCDTANTPKNSLVDHRCS